MCNLPQQKEKLLKAIETPEEEHPSDNQPKEEIGEATLVENQRLVTKKITKIHISVTTFGFVITGG